MDTLERAATLVDQYRYLEAYDLIEKADLDAKIKARHLNEIALKLRQHFERYAPVSVTLKHRPDRAMLDVYQLLIDRDYAAARGRLANGTIKNAKAWIHWIDQVYEQERRLAGEAEPPVFLINERDDEVGVRVIGVFVIIGALLALLTPLSGLGVLIMVSGLPAAWYVTQRRYVKHRPDSRLLLNRFLKAKLSSILAASIVFVAGQILMNITASSFLNWSGVGFTGLAFFLSGWLAIWFQRVVERYLKSGSPNV